MEAQKILEAAKFYIKHLNSLYEPERADDKILTNNPQVWLRHATWLANQIPELVGANKINKAQRWLACVQGILLATGQTTIEQAKLINMPKGVNYNRDI